MRRFCLNLFCVAAFVALACRNVDAAGTVGKVQVDKSARTVTMSDAAGSLVIRLAYGGCCYLDKVIVDGREVVVPENGVCSAVEIGGQWSTTRSGMGSPIIHLTANTVDVDNIDYGPSDFRVREEWRFTVGSTAIDWRIKRRYLAGGVIDDTGFPGWDFASTDTWTAGLLDTGGVAWPKLIDAASSYGAHARAVTFWKDGERDALRVATRAPSATVAARFSHQPQGYFSYFQTVSSDEIDTRQGLRRSVGGVHVWAPMQVQPGAIDIDMTLRAVSNSSRGEFRGIDGGAVNRLMNTIGRYGVIDHRILGGNGWRSGFCCLHEQWFGAMGIAIDDPDYTRNLVSTIDDWRKYAVKADGRVMARWCHEAGGDNMVPGTYDPKTGYYDCGWGYLLDAQPDFVINTSEAFDLTGDVGWLRSEKGTCERVLDWMLARDLDHSGLMSMMTDSRTARKSSDWIDVVYACGKNALVNAEMYEALNLWSGRELILGDKARAERYRSAAARLRAAFVRPISEGGFWDPDRRCFDYWREVDRTVHGINLVIPVNLCAAAYGLSTPDQSRTVLDNIEEQMVGERLFHWPLCFTSYSPNECGGQMPFPQYENGDIFLSWGELGVRAYARYRPEVAVKYVRAVLDQYQKDGLACQRYLRATQTGTGDDILAGNSMTIVGLYRDLYGIRPLWNRLLIDPHLTPQLAGTRLRYRLRGRRYDLVYGQQATSVSVDRFAVQAAGPFAVDTDGNKLSCYRAESEAPAIVFKRSSDGDMKVVMTEWPAAAGETRWADSGASIRAVCGLTPGRQYKVSVDGRRLSVVKADASGTIVIAHPAEGGMVAGGREAWHRFVLTSVK